MHRDPQSSASTPATSEPPVGNPFATRHVRPGAMAFLFPDATTVDDLVARLAANNWRGEIVGPHGSGKSTLLAALVPAIEGRGRSVVVYRLREGERRMPATPRDVRTLAANEVVVVDGYEQLPRWRKWTLRALCKRRGLGLLTTTHARTGLPLVWETSVERATVERVVASLLSSQAALAASISRDDIDAALALHPTNVREVLFALYDAFERRRGAAD